MPFPDWMPQYRMSFPIESEHFGPARLYITPNGYEKDTNGNLAPDHRDRVYGLYIAVRFEDDSRGLKYEINDFVQPECFQALASIVVESANEQSPALLQGDDGFIDISFHRESDERLRVLCKSPSPGWNVTCLRLQLDCVVKSESLAEIRQQIGKLIGLVEQIDTGTMEA